MRSVSLDTAAHTMFTTHPGSVNNTPVWTVCYQGADVFDRMGLEYQFSDHIIRVTVTCP